jgi:hypothetical protein
MARYTLRLINLTLFRKKKVDVVGLLPGISFD